MPRQARIVVPGAPHHVVQRGNRRQRTFFSDSDFVAYRWIAAEEFRKAGVEVWAYCLMPNHVHIIATPGDIGGLARAVGATHLAYAKLINRREGWTGSIWQGRFGSFPVEGHLLTCARYVGLNPVRAGLVRRAADWPWSSVRAHLSGNADPLVSPEALRELLGGHLAGFFDEDVDEATREGFRVASVAGRLPATFSGHVPKVRVPLPSFTVR